MDKVSYEKPLLRHPYVVDGEAHSPDSRALDVEWQTELPKAVGRSQMVPLFPSEIPKLHPLGPRAEESTMGSPLVVESDWAPLVRLLVEDTRPSTEVINKSAWYTTIRTSAPDSRTMFHHQPT